jgi:hypothetical protein
MWYNDDTPFFGYRAVLRYVANPKKLQMEQIGRALGLSAGDTDDVLCPNSNNQRDTGWDGNEAEVMITNEEGGNNESWILTGGVVQGPPQAQQMVAPTIARANVHQGLATAQNQGPQPQQQPAAHQQQ